MIGHAVKDSVQSEDGVSNLRTQLRHDILRGTQFICELNTFLIYDCHFTVSVWS